MPTTTDKELQARLLREAYELSVKKQKLEDDIRKHDAMDISLQETAAMHEIEAHRSHFRLPKLRASY